MAKFLGAPTSGSVAGQTYSHNRAGQYIRNRRSPVQPQDTSRRGEVRGFLTTASAAFSALTHDQVEAWNTSAQGVVVTDSLGQSLTLTGHQLFVRINSQLLNLGQPMISDPPSDFSVFSFAILSAVATDAPSFILTLDAAVPADSFLLIAASPQRRNGRSFENSFSQIMVADNADTAAINIAAAYAARYPEALVAGNVIFLRIIAVSPTGVTSAPVIRKVPVGG